LSLIALFPHFEPVILEEAKHVLIRTIGWPKRSVIFCICNFTIFGQGVLNMKMKVFLLLACRSLACRSIWQYLITELGMQVVL